MAMTKQQLIDLYFLDARARLIDLAAFLDRIERAAGDEDFRMAGFRKALTELAKSNPHKAGAVLLALSDPTTEPIEQAHGKGACGAWPGEVAK
jgi:hypothetical protein